MLSVLIEGTLTQDPVSRLSSKGSTFATASMRTTGEDGQAVWCNVITFSTSAVEALTALSTGDVIAITGEAALNHWETAAGEHRVGLRVTASRVLSVYEAGKRRMAADPRKDKPHES